METDKSYNGWTNWETWHTALLADNTESTEKQAVALGARCADIRAGRVKGKVYDPGRAAAAYKRILAGCWRETRTFARENAREFGGGWREPLGTVNWLEIAESYMDEADLDRQYREGQEVRP